MTPMSGKAVRFNQIPISSRSKLDPCSIGIERYELDQSVQSKISRNEIDEENYEKVGSSELVPRGWKDGCFKFDPDGESGQQDDVEEHLIRETEQQKGRSHTQGNSN